MRSLAFEPAAARRCVALGLAWALLQCASCSPGAAGPPSLAELAPPADSDRPESWAPHYEAMAALGEGFVVWESFRDGHWRIWMRALDGSPEQRLSPDEPGRDHVAAHVAPDGRHVVYLSLPAPHRDFAPIPPGESAPLHLVRLEGRRVADDRVLVADARPYDGSRVALWVSPRALIYVAGDRTTRQIDILTGEEEILVPDPSTRYGMLVNAARTHATNGTPTFSIYHPGDRTVSRRPRLPGCEPYFTPDGRLGYWVADVGGPIRSYDLADSSTAVVIDRDSKWLPKGHGYLYYPMASADARLLAFGASKNRHGHFDEDFDVFVAPLDPERFEVTGSAVRYSFSPGTDRFPDVWVAGSELGRHRGEAPLRVELAPDPGSGESGTWSVDFGDGTPPGPATSHVYEAPGTYALTARRGERVLRGEATVEPGTPPRLVRVDVLPGGSELSALFDEPVDVGGASARLESGARVAGLRAGATGRDLVVVLGDALAGSDVLVVGGVADRAERPNVLASARAPVEMAAWPGAGEGLVFAFATGGAERPVRDVDTGHERSFSLVAHGRARYDAHGALRVTGGWFEVEELPKRLSAAFRESGAFTLEATVWPELRRTKGPARIVSLARDASSQNLSLSQDEGDAVLRVRVTEGGAKDQAVAEIGPLATGLPNHLLVSYRPGRLVAYKDGRVVVDTDSVRGDLSDWRDEVRLAIGADPAGGGRDFAGRVEGVALYTRFLEPDEAAAHANAYLHEIARREPVARLRMKARLLAASEVPTPGQIVPYREALVVREYEVPEARRAKLGAERVRVAHWAVLDGQPQALPAGSPGARVPLELEPFDRHPHLESTYLSSTLDVDPAVPLFVDVAD